MRQYLIQNLIDREYVVADDAVGTVGFGVFIDVITGVSSVVKIDGVIPGTGANVVIIMDIVVTL